MNPTGPGSTGSVGAAREPLLVATHNAHKTGEFRAMLGDLFASVSDLASVPGMVPPEETGETFEANAAIKALAASRERPEAWVLADDSGLVVDALDGAPGVRSARYAGEGSDDAANRRKLLEELSRPELAGRLRTARFRCVLALARGGEILVTFAGSVEGRIVEGDRGKGGFGYDPLFVPEGHEATFGELPESVKNELSHRARAIEGFRRWWEESDRGGAAEPLTSYWAERKLRPGFKRLLEADGLGGGTDSTEMISEERSSRDEGTAR